MSPTTRELREEMELARARAEEQAHADTRRDLAWTAVRCLGWCFTGLLLMAWAFHTTDMTLGRIAFSSGIMIGNGGIIVSLLRAYLRGERRGDW